MGCNDDEFCGLETTENSNSVTSDTSTMSGKNFNNIIDPLYSLSKFSKFVFFLGVNRQYSNNKRMQ